MRRACAEGPSRAKAKAVQPHVYSVMYIDSMPTHVRPAPCVVAQDSHSRTTAMFRQSQVTVQRQAGVHGRMGAQSARSDAWHTNTQQDHKYHYVYTIGLPATLVARGARYTKRLGYSNTEGSATQACGAWKTVTKRLLGQQRSSDTSSGILKHLRTVFLPVCQYLCGRPLCLRAGDCGVVTPVAPIQLFRQGLFEREASEPCNSDTTPSSYCAYARRQERTHPARFRSKRRTATDARRRSSHPEPGRSIPQLAARSIDRVGREGAMVTISQSSGRDV